MNLQGVKQSLLDLIPPPRAPERLARRFLSLSEAGRGRLEAALVRDYFAGDTAWLATREGQKDLTDHLTARLDIDRNTVVPWLDDARALDGASILEIGCGTGASTVALAEQGARVTAVDVHEPSLAVARERCALYGVDAELVAGNAGELGARFQGRRFDLILFFASLEHMTHEERLTALRGAWDLLADGQLLGVVETPNRLAYFDGHTALMPFFLWLPDDLAFKYMRYSQREFMKDRYRDWSPEAHLDFLRRGRGVSYHEFELALERPAASLDVVSDQGEFLRRRSAAARLAWSASRGGRYVQFLANVGPTMHRGFYEPSLDLLIRKTAR